MKKILLLLTSLVLLYTGIAQTKIIKHTYYTIYFNTEKKLPNYTYYVLIKAHRAQKAGRTKFHADTQIDDGKQTDVAAYDGRGADTCAWYDAGHLAPDDDFRFSAQAEADAMVFTNVAPQQANFNETAWRTVENAVRKLCDEHGDVKVWTGVSYSGGKKVNGIPQPSYYWKVVTYNGGKIEWIGFNICKKKRKEKDLRVSNNEIERRTNLTFN